MVLYILDYGAGNVASLANSVRSLGFDFKWIESVEDIEKADRILFPGVGAFGSAMASLQAKGFVEPLRKYIRSGRPYMGICIGMQVLFKSSTESPEQEGLGIIDGTISQFSKATKAVPSIGWNAAQLVRSAESGTPYGLTDEDGTSYYFVHSFRADYYQSEAVKDWALTVTQYGEEVYTSSVQKGEVFATQFHPEKSGKAGLAVLKAWLSQGEAGAPVASGSSTASKRPAEEVVAGLKRNGFKKRVVACLDVRTNDDGDLVVTKGDQYDVREAEPEAPVAATPADPSASTSASANDDTTPPSLDPSATKPSRQVRNLGKPVDLARRYFAEGADEVTFLNITSFRSCPLHDQPMLDVVRQSAETVFVPLTIGGGIRDTVDPDGTRRSALEVAGTYFRCGADKVSIGSDAVDAVEAYLASGKKSGTSGIETISVAYGAQAVVVSVDPKRVYANSIEDVAPIHRPSVVDLQADLPDRPGAIRKELGPNGERYCWYACTVKGGRETRDMDVVQLGQGVEALGAGEILLNSVDRDGSKAGFDLRLVALMKRSVGIPVIASSGAGKVEDFEEVFNATDVEAALAAGIFHRREVPLQAVKDYLKGVGIPARREA